MIEYKTYLSKAADGRIVSTLVFEPVYSVQEYDHYSNLTQRAMDTGRLKTSDITNKKYYKNPDGETDVLPTMFTWVQ